MSYKLSLYCNLVHDNCMSRLRELPPCVSCLLVKNQLQIEKTWMVVRGHVDLMAQKSIVGNGGNDASRRGNGTKVYIFYLLSPFA